MKIIAGLGNPGFKYANTRHNCGFLTLDVLEAVLNTNINKKEHDALTGQSIYKGQKLLLVKPQSFMNLSGYPLIRLANYYKVELQDILVIYDDMDTAPGSLRLRRNGSSGGHNGMGSIIEQSGSTQINRLKIGIGRSLFPNSADYVLSPFPPEQLPLMAEIFAKAAEAALCWAAEGIGPAMNQYNTKKEKSPKKIKEADSGDNISPEKIDN